MTEVETDAQAGTSHNLTDVPSVADYKAALKAGRDVGLLKGDKAIVVDMLRANYQAPGHGLTAGELAAQVGLTVKEASLKYNGYSKDVCKRLSREPKIKMTILVNFSGGKAGPRPDLDESARWTLHAALVTALEESWFSHLKPEA